MSDPPRKRERRSWRGAAQASKHNDQIAADNTAVALRIQRLALHLHDLGPRAVYELLTELADLYGDGVLHRLAAYGRIDRDVLHAVGGDRFPSAVLRRVA